MPTIEQLRTELAELGVSRESTRGLKKGTLEEMLEAAIAAAGQNAAGQNAANGEDVERDLAAPAANAAAPPAAAPPAAAAPAAPAVNAAALPAAPAVNAAANVSPRTRLTRKISSAKAKILSIQGQIEEEKAKGVNVNRNHPLIKELKKAEEGVQNAEGKVALYNFEHGKPNSNERMAAGPKYSPNTRRKMLKKKERERALRRERQSRRLPGYVHPKPKKGLPFGSISFKVRSQHEKRTRNLRRLGMQVRRKSVNPYNSREKLLELLKQQKEYIAQHASLDTEIGMLRPRQGELSRLLTAHNKEYKDDHDGIPLDEMLDKFKGKPDRIEKIKSNRTATKILEVVTILTRVNKSINDKEQEQKDLAKAIQTNATLIKDTAKYVPEYMLKAEQDLARAKRIAKMKREKEEEQAKYAETIKAASNITKKLGVRANTA